jgi:FO synthase
MNESISRAAGASHGQEVTPAEMQALIRSAGRIPAERTTTYGIREMFTRQASHPADVTSQQNRHPPRRPDGGSP